MNATEDVLTLRDLVRRYLAAKAYRRSWQAWNRLQVKGVARERAIARANRELEAAESALEAFVGWTKADSLAAHR